MANAGIIFIDNTARVFIEGLTNKSDGTKINSGVTVTATINDAGGNAVTQITLTSDGGDGDWSEVVGTDDLSTLSDGDKVDVVFEADGGSPNLQFKMTKVNVPVVKRTG